MIGPHDVPDADRSSLGVQWAEPAVRLEMEVQGMAALLPIEFWASVEKLLCEGVEPHAVQLVRRVGDDEALIDSLSLNAIKARQAVAGLSAPPPELHAALATLNGEGGDVGEVSQPACKALAVVARVWTEKRLRELTASESKVRVRVRGTSTVGVSKTVRLGTGPEETSIATLEPSPSQEISEARALVSLAVEETHSLTRSSAIVHGDLDARAQGHLSMMRAGYEELLTGYKALNADQKQELRVKDARIQELEKRNEALQDKFADRMSETSAIQGVIAADQAKTGHLKEAWTDTLSMLGGAFTIHSLAKSGLGPQSLPLIQWASENPQVIARLSDPRIMRLLSDPELVKAISSPAVLTLLQDPDFLAEVENPKTRRELLKGLAAYAAKAAAGA